MTSKFPQLEDRAWLESQYQQDQRSLNEIADLVGCTGMTVHRALVQHGIPRRPASSRGTRFPELEDADWLREAYWQRGQSHIEIAEAVGCTDSAVAAAFRKLGIPRRTSTESRRLRSERYRNRIDWIDVERRYAAGEGFEVIGRDWGVTGHFIRKVLLERGVKVRTKAEQVRIEMTRLQRLEAMQQRARTQRRPTGVRGMKQALSEGSRCVFCGEAGLLHQHHLNAVRSDNRSENLVPLCPDCHRKVEWFIGHATSGLQSVYRREVASPSD